MNDITRFLIKDQIKTEINVILTHKKDDKMVRYAIQEINRIVDELLEKIPSE